MNTVSFDSVGSNQLVSAAAYQTAENIARWRVRLNADTIRKALAEFPMKPGFNVDSIGGGNLDAVGGDAAVFLARQLEFLHNRIITQTYEDLNALALIPTDASVPAGAKTHTIAREQFGGEMVFHKGNSRNLGQTSYEIEEEEFKIWAAVTKIDLNFFDEMAADFAGVSLESKFRQAATRVADEFINDKTWFGDEDHGVPGMLNARFSMKASAAVTFGPGGASASAQLNELHRLANLNGEHTKNVFRPTALGAPIEYINHWSNTLLNDANSSNQSILEAFLDKNRYISQVLEIHEFSDAGTRLGVPEADVLLFFRPGDLDAAHKVMPQGLTFLPLQRSGFDMYVPAFLLFGGVNQYKPLHNTVVYADFA